MLRNLCLPTTLGYFNIPFSDTNLTQFNFVTQFYSHVKRIDGVWIWWVWYLCLPVCRVRFMAKSKRGLWTKKKGEIHDSDITLRRKGLLFCPPKGEGNTQSFFFVLGIYLLIIVVSSDFFFSVIMMKRRCCQQSWKKCAKDFSCSFILF